MSPVQHLNPDGMLQSPAFSQAIVVTGSAKIIYVGGQDAVAAKGNVIGKGDLKAQTEQIFKNLETVLSAAGAKLEHVVKWTIFVMQGQDVRPGLGVFQEKWDRRTQPPAMTVTFVAGLAHPDFLAEIEAIAVVPEA